MRSPRTAGFGKRHPIGSPEAESGLNVWPAFADMLVLMTSVLLLALLAILTAMHRPPETPGSGEGGKVMMHTQFFDDAKFLRNKSNLKDAETKRQIIQFAREKLPAWVAQVRRDSPVQNFLVIVEVTGHADAEPVKGDRWGNWKLATERAQTVLQEIIVLTEQDAHFKNSLNFHPELLNPENQETVFRVASFGQYLPSCPYPEANEFWAMNPTHRQKFTDPNRRVEIRVYAEPHVFDRDEDHQREL